MKIRRILIQFGADKNAIDKYGETPKEVGESKTLLDSSVVIDNHAFMRRSVQNF